MNLDNPNTVPAPETNQVISGDLFPPTMSVEPPQETTTSTEMTSATTPGQKVVIGDKEFNSTEEALAYYEGFERSQKKTAASMTLEEPQTTQSVVQPKRLGQLIFEDPDQALNTLKEQAKEEMRAEQRAIDKKNKFWEDFYLKHPDLKGSELLVDAVLGKEQAEGRFRVTWEQASEQAPILAAKARQEVSKIRNVPSGGQALPSNPAMVAGASGASTPRVPASKPAPTTFVEELAARRRKG